MKASKDIDKTSTWRGFDLDELRYRRILMRARIEAGNQELAGIGESARDALPSLGSNALKSIIRSLNLVDYAFLALKLYRRASTVFGKVK